MSDFNMKDRIEEDFKRLVEAREKAFFESYKLTGQLSEAVLVMNPKHKDQMGEFLSVSGLKIPVLYSKCVEGDKAYMVIDREMARNVRESHRERERRRK